MRQVIALLLFMVPGLVMGQSKSECETLFQRITAEAAGKRATLNKKGFEMVCKLRITQSDKNVQQDVMEVYYTGSRYYYKSKALTMYQDEQHLVTIQRDPKLVFITRAQPVDTRQQQFNQMQSLMDSLQKHMVLQVCSKEFGTVRKDEGYYKMIFTGTAALKGSGIKNVTYWLHTGSNTVRKIRIEFTPANAYGLMEYEMVIEKINYDYKGKPFEGQALAQVMQGRVLKGDFKGYELIDKR